MGIQINGNNDIISALDGSWTAEGASINTSGILTATTFEGNVTGTACTFVDGKFTGTVSIGGTLTYEDVTNIDSVGLITARAGIIDSTLTAGRVVHVNSDKRLVDSANLTFSGTQLVVQGGSGTQHMFRHSAGWGGVTSAGSAGGSGAGFSLANNYSGTLETKWSIYLDGSNDGLRFTANTPDQTSDEKLRITSAGKLGIGTITPGDLVHINTTGNVGGIRFGNGQNLNAGTIRSNWNTIDLIADQNLTLQTNGDTRMKITNAGKVGIGTVTPGKQLHVFKSNEHPVMFERGDSSNTQVELKTNGATRGYWGCSTTANFMVYDNDASDINFTVLQTGKVGINEDVPQATLHVASTSNYVDIGLSNSTSGHTGSDGANIFYNSNLELALWNRESASIRFATAGTERARIDGSGHATFKRSFNLTSSSDNHQIYEGRALNWTSNGTSSGTVRAYLYGDSSGNLRLGSGGWNERLRINSDGEIGINQTDPQAFLHIGNYETAQNENQSSVTQYFIDSTRSLKIARCNRGSITSTAAWYDVAVLAMAGYSYRCQVSIGGNFTQDVVEINVQTSYDSSLGNKYSLQVSAKSASAHSVDRITQVRVAKKSSTHYLQVYIATGVDSNTNGKSVLETTCGIYAQNGADNAYPMFAAASGSYTNLCHTFPDFGVHAAWDFTSNSSGVRSYTAWTGGGQNYLTAEAAGNGSSHGNVARFTAPMRGLYQVNFMVKAINATIDNDCLISMYGSMTYNAQNPWGINSEVYDPRGAAAGAQGQQGEGNSWFLRMAAGDYFSFDYYRPAPTGYIDGGGQIFTASVFKVNS
jgi:hypothetical protein